ncbi:MAG: LacI family DNA-binding transcriptional regulator [Aeromonadaceae bacterium]|nr:LacI family DNA-binding transcriptional regulator [Aeromonadaceae bacterium]MBP8772737.1 LacI family DNA-binding transcriptional regulator [Aeromonadaceae bacterium]
MNTIRDVARLAGVSVATVSRVLNEPDKVAPKTQARVKEVMVELNFIPNLNARSLATSRSGVIGILVNNISGGYYARIIDSIEAEARRRNVFTLINCGNHDSNDVMDAALRLASRQCDAIIASVPFMDDEGLQRFLAMQPNAVLLNCISALHRERSLAVDNRYGVRLALDHLYALGHRQIGLISGPEENSECELRLSACRDWFQVQGLVEPLIQAGDFSAESGRQAAATLLQQHPEITALFCFNDHMAIGALHHAQHIGMQVPEQLSIVGFDNNELAVYSDPALTTVAQPLEQLGERALHLAQQLIAGEAHEPQALLLPELVVRQSTASPRP